MGLEEVREARRLRVQARELMRRAEAQRGHLGEVVAQLTETRRAVQRVRLQARGEKVARDGEDAAERLTRIAHPSAAVPWHSQRDWLNRFTAHLCSLRTDLGSDAALEVALDAWPSFWLMAPETAARSMAAICRSTTRPTP